MRYFRGDGMDDLMIRFSENFGIQINQMSDRRTELVPQHQGIKDLIIGQYLKAHII